MISLWQGSDSQLKIVKITDFLMIKNSENSTGTVHKWRPLFMNSSTLLRSFIKTSWRSNSPSECLITIMWKGLAFWAGGTIILKDPIVPYHRPLLYHKCQWCQYANYNQSNFANFWQLCINFYLNEPTSLKFLKNHQTFV